MPYLKYCCEIWGNTYKSRVQPLHIIQKRAIRICQKADFRSHSRPLFYQLGYHWTYQHRMQGFGSLCQERGASRETTSLPTIHVPYAYEVFPTKICQSLIDRTFGSEIRTFKISSVSSTDLIITTATDSFGSISPGSQELNCRYRDEIYGFLLAAG